MRDEGIEIDLLSINGLSLMASAAMIFWMFYMLNKNMPVSSNKPTGTLGVRG